MNTAETLQPFCSLQSSDCLKAITEKLKVSELEVCEGGVRTAASVHVQAPVVACLGCCDTPLIVGLGGEPPTDSVNSPATRHRWILMSQISFHKQPAVTFHLNESRSVSAGGCSWCQCVVRTVAGGPQPRTSPSATHNTLLPAGDIHILTLHTLYLKLLL